MTEPNSTTPKAPTPLERLTAVFEKSILGHQAFNEIQLRLNERIIKRLSALESELAEIKQRLS